MTPKPPLSPWRRHGDLLFLSGQIGVEADGSIPDDLRRQVELSIEALSRALEDGGSSLESVLRTTVYITRQEDFGAMNEVYARFFGEPWPARTTLVTGLALPPLLFEIEAVAAVSHLG